MAIKPYNPSIHTASNKPYGMAQSGPTDARSYFYDPDAGSYRPYASTAEANQYLTPVKYRAGSFPVYITVSNVVTEYWYSGGTADTDLKQKASGNATNNQSGMVQIATDQEMQVTSVPPDNNHVPNVQRIYNWWWWLIGGIDSVRSIYARWWWEKVSFLVHGSPINSPLHGDAWLQTNTNNSDLKLQRANGTDTVICSSSNADLAGTTQRMMTCNTVGGLFGTHEIYEQIVTDGVIINACDTASFNTQGISSTLVLTAPKIMYKGQIAKGLNNKYLYLAISDNIVARIQLT